MRLQRTRSEVLGCPPQAPVSVSSEEALGGAEQGKNPGPALLLRAGWLPAMHGGVRFGPTRTDAEA